MNRMQAIVAIFVFQLVTVHALVESHVVYHSVITGSATPWQKGSRLAENRVIHIDFALAAPADSLNAAVQALQNISDPNSQNFGQYWTTEAVAQLLAPSQDQIREVARWLNDSGIPRSSLRASSDRGHIYFNTTVHRAEQLLGAQYNDYSDGQVVQVTSDTYYLPLSISKYVDFVLPTLPRSRPHTGLEATTLVQQPGSNRTDTSAVVEVDCFQYMTPECLRLLYNIPDVTNVSSHPNNSFGVYEEAWSTWIPEDLDAFFTDFQPELVGNRPSVLPVDGGFRQTDVQALIFNEEANLDFEYTMSLAYPLPVTNIQVGDEFILGDLNNMLAAFDQHYCVMGLNPEFDPIYPDTEYAGGYNASDCGVDKPTLVISISYAWNEAWYSERYLQRQCLEFLKLGLRGVTVIAASGDRGSADQRNLCIDPETGTANVSEGYFSSNFPASCPWVTGVGGTQLTPTNQSWVKGSRAFPPETALDTTLGSASTIVSSGGGFSNIFSAPFYQSAAVEAYLTQPEHRAHLANLSLSGYFNPHGRGYPDVSVVALNYLVFTNGNLRSGTGTSASTPVFASMIARINDARLRAGKGPVGFVNAVLYAYQHKIMRDVETGSNSGCGVSEAFPAQEGWDAVTGLGSPDFEKLLDLYLHLP